MFGVTSHRNRWLQQLYYCFAMFAVLEVGIALIHEEVCYENEHCVR